MNLHAVRAIYSFEMARTWRTLMQSIVSPVISTSLYFVVFGAAIGSRITADRRRQLRRVHRAGPDHAVAADAEHLQRLVRHLLSADSPARSTSCCRRRSRCLEIVLGYVGAAATKSIILGLIILATAGLFVPLHIAHPFWMIAFLVLTAVTFSLFGFIIGIWADGFEKLQSCRC